MKTQRKTVKLFLAACCLAWCFGTAMAQQGPGWVNAGAGELPAQVVEELPVSHYSPPAVAASNSESVGGGSGAAPPAVLNAGNEADLITAEIQALADGLRHDPDAMFQWVRGHITYTHYYGLRKGAALTLLEGSGNDADTSALLVALLRASGIEARYRSGFCRLSLSEPDDFDLEHWLGIDPVAAVAETLLLARGTPGADLLTEESSPGNPTGRYFLRRVWVEGDVNGTSYWFDPSFKTLTHVAGVNMTTASGYSRSALLTSAGGTVNGAAVSGLNETALADHLRDRTTALLTYVQSNLPNERTLKLTGGFESAALPASVFRCRISRRQRWKSGRACRQRCSARCACSWVGWTAR
jgi:hypothetical protein